MVVKLIGSHDFICVLIAIKSFPFDTPHGTLCVDILNPSFGKKHPFHVMVTRVPAENHLILLFGL